MAQNKNTSDKFRPLHNYCPQFNKQQLNQTLGAKPSWPTSKNININGLKSILRAN